MLVEKFIKSLQSTHDVANNSYLSFLKAAVEKVESAANSDPRLIHYVDKLISLINQPSFALDGRLTNEFAQTLGEAHFFVLCLEKGISLTRIQEQSHKTPDFQLKIGALDLFFEVKTLSVVDGQIGISKHLDDALDARIEIEEQLKEGKRIASAISVIQPYGAKPYIKGKGTITAVIETLIEKTRQNIKRDQYSNENSFLVINLSIIPPCCTENYTLRPAYPDDYLFNKAVTGDLWMLAFGKPGMLIHGTPEFEGKPCIEGILNKFGILSDPEFDNIAGIFLMVHPWQRPTEIWGLFTSQKYTQWQDYDHDIATTIFALTDNNWNDDLDSNGWDLKGVQ
jgi:hypothetical protein